MKTHFYNRTPYAHVDVTVPQCFLDLDENFDANYSEPTEMFSGLSLKLAENTCRRMADIDMYAKLIEDTLRDQNPYRAATLTGSWIVGYLSACKSLLDACSIALAELYALPLSNKEKDFTKRKFWKELAKAAKEVYDRYSHFRTFVSSVVRWRDSAIHRLTPLVIVHGPGHPNAVSREDMKIKMIAQPDTDIKAVLRNPKGTNWVDPLALHSRWRDSFICLCENLCLDIQKNLTIAGPGVSAVTR